MVTSFPEDSGTQNINEMIFIMLKYTNSLIAIVLKYIILYLQIPFFYALPYY